MTAGISAQAVAPAQVGGQILLETRGMSKTFGGLKAVDNVSLALREGIVTTLVGPNGAGKTTLFNLITGHLEPAAGEVTGKLPKPVSAALFRT
jgi:branched-chain amino acid transport system ATP-binding protein